jgi:ribose transport system substrate-binding protein
MVVDHSHPKQEVFMNRHLRIVLAILLVLLAASPMFATGTGEKPKSKTVTVAFMPGVADPFYYTMERGIRAKAKELGVNLIVAEYPTEWGPAKQVPILEAMMAKGGIDVLLIAPTSVDSLVAPLKKIYDSGVQIITVDTFLGDGDYTKTSNYSFPLAFIGTDNVLGGKQVAEHLAKLVGEKGKVFMENTNPGVSSVQGRLDGFKAGIAEFPNMTFVGTDYCMDVQQKAMEQVAAALQKNPDMVGIFGCNVFTAQGAYQAVVNAGLTGAVKVVTWDATESLIAALKAGQVDLILAQKPAEIGSLGVEWAVKYMKDKSIPPSKKVIPGFEFFTKSNVDDPNMQQWIYKK